MNMPAYHQSIYRVVIQSFAEPLVLLSAELHEARSEISHGIIRVALSQTEDLPDVGSRISLDWQVGLALRYWHGMVISVWGYCPGCIEIKVASYLHKLTRQYIPKHFVHLDVASVIKKILLPLYETANIIIDITKTLPEHELIIHQGSDDYALLERLLSQDQLYFYEKHEREGSSIVIGDLHTPKFNPASISINAKHVRDLYNWHQGHQRHFETVETGIHVNDIIAQDWVVETMTHYCDESEAVNMGSINESRSRYYAYIIAHPITEVLAQASRSDQLTTSELRMAKVHSFEQGKYQLILDHDEASESPTPPIPSLTPYSGNEFGIHWPLPNQASIITSSLDGNSDKPIILGTLNRAIEKHHHHLKTAGGHQLLFNDTPDQTAIRLSSEEAGCYLHMNTKINEELISLCNTKGGIDMHADGTIHLSSGEGTIVETEADGIISVTKNIHMKSDEGDIQINAGSKHKFTAGDDLVIDVGKNLTLDIKGQYITDVKSGYILNVAEGNYNTSVHEGSMHWSVGDELVLKSKNGYMTLVCGGASIVLHESGDIEITGRHIKLAASEIHATQLSHISND